MKTTANRLKTLFVAALIIIGSSPVKKLKLLLQTTTMETQAHANADTLPIISGFSRHNELPAQVRKAFRFFIKNIF